MQDNDTQQKQQQQKRNIKKKLQKKYERTTPETEYRNKKLPI